MQAIEPIRITAGNFAAYGRYYNLRGEDGARLADGRTFVSRQRISGEPLKIGATAVAGGPFVSSKMERHTLSEELLICGTTRWFSRWRTPTRRERPGAGTSGPLS